MNSHSKSIYRRLIVHIVLWILSIEDFSPSSFYLHHLSSLFEFHSFTSSIFKFLNLFLFNFMYNLLWSLANWSSKYCIFHRGINKIKFWANSGLSVLVRVCCISLTAMRIYNEYKTHCSVLNLILTIVRISALILN